MDKKTDTRIIGLLKNKKKLDEKKIQDFFDIAYTKQVSPIPLVAKESKLSEKELLEFLAKEFHIKYLDITDIVVDVTLIQRIPVKIASYFKFMPLFLENRILTVAVAYPLDIKIQDEIRTHLGYDVKIVLSCEHQVLEMLNKYYGWGADTVDKIIAQKTYQSHTQAEKEAKVDDLEESSDQISIIQLVNQIILEAYKKRATDIHIEPYRKKLRLRYRIDGILYDANVSGEMKNFLIPVLSRIKLMANLNIVERRIPQDGRAIVKIQDENLDLRVSFIPTPHGESVVIRLLPMVMLFNLDKLGLAPDELKFFKELINKPHGIIFLTGPTGSGKTTTLYACLSSINTSERKIITIEDPIEYELEGITQIQIASEFGLSFARGLRSMLRHDPDVMMVGEVRDRETADIAIRVALTGHLVFSTLHTNDAASGITRLIDIGLEPYLVASSVDVFIAQRLVRVICPKCRQEDKDVSLTLKEQITKELGLNAPQEIKIYKGKGCPACNNTGFYGRTAIHEILTMSEQIKELTSRKAASDQIKKVAITSGMRTLRQSGWLKVLEGITTTEEILRVTQSDDLQDMVQREDVVQQEIKNNENLKKVKLTIDKNKIKSPNKADRRIYDRSEDDSYIRFKFFKQKQQGQKNAEYEPEMIGVLKNISAGGVFFSASESLNKGVIIDLVIELKEGEKNIECLARVIRCNELVANRNYDIGVCFLDLPNSERSRLNRYVLKMKE
ncbi:MAG: ATPase, T2SS/T4P/T4SS family [Candidatus Omnitrophota bacterium]